MSSFFSGFIPYIVVGVVGILIGFGGHARLANTKFGEFITKIVGGAPKAAPAPVTKTAAKKPMPVTKAKTAAKKKAPAKKKTTTKKK